ncbi:MAG: AraC family transcriptional regulator [Treponema sp.]|jgi:AraC-like DNA-binding protein|nr:AraC family transcriptional regulator [Treponema sp.]
MDLDFSSLPLARKSTRYSSRVFPLHALTLLSGHSRETSTDYYNNGRRRDFGYYAVWQYTIGGRGRIKMGGQDRDILPGSLMVLTVPGDEIYYLPEDSEYWEFVFLVMTGRDTNRVVKAVQNSRGILLAAGGIPRTMERFYLLIQDLFSGKITNPFDNSTRSYGLCMALMEEAGNPGNMKEKNSFEELQVLLQDNLYRDIPVEEMAELTKLSRSHFTRLFTGKLGLSPRKYLEELRLRTAGDMLAGGNISVKEAAIQVGIRDVNYFCRIFKKRFGVSPGKYRETVFKELPPPPPPPFYGGY